jgi:hypothetical protein
VAAMAEQIFKELAARITARERNHRETERWAWERHDYMTAIRVRGLADGLEAARDILVEVIAETKALESVADVRLVRRPGCTDKD